MKQQEDKISKLENKMKHLAAKGPDSSLWRLVETEIELKGQWTLDLNSSCVRKQEIQINANVAQYLLYVNT